MSSGRDTACAVRALRGGALQQQLHLRSPYPYLIELVCYQLPLATVTLGVVRSLVLQGNTVNV